MLHQGEVYCITFQNWDDYDDFYYYYRIHIDHKSFKDEDDLIDSIRLSFPEFEMFEEKEYEMGLIFHKTPEGMSIQENLDRLESVVPDRRSTENPIIHSMTDTRHDWM